MFAANGLPFTLPLIAICVAYGCFVWLWERHKKKDDDDYFY